MKYGQQFIFAVKFLTRIPLAIKVDYTEDLPAKSMAYYPLVGAILGLLLLVVDLTASYFFPSSVINIIMLITLIYFTGGLHLDGFMDSIDGLFSGRKKDRMLEIMHDSRTGAFGVIAAILLILFKYILLLELNGVNRYPVIFLMPIISRWMMVYVAYQYPLAKGSKIAKMVSKYLNYKQPLIATCWLVLFAFIVSYLTAFSFYYIIIIFLICWLFSLAFAANVKKKIDGLTGDIYGAVNEIVEVIVILTFLALVR